VKSHLAVTLARWSGDAYLLTSQKLLQDQYEREFGDVVQVVKGRDNYACERYPDARVPTSLGMCRRRAARSASVPTRARRPPRWRDRCSARTRGTSRRCATGTPSSCRAAGC